MTVIGNTIKSGFFRGLPKMEEYKQKTSGLDIDLTFRLADGFCLGAWFQYHSKRYDMNRMDTEERLSLIHI